MSFLSFRYDALRSAPLAHGVTELPVRPAVGKLTRVQFLEAAYAAAAVPARPRGPAEVHQLAARGLAGSAQPLPHHDRIQRLFGRHGVGDVRAHVGGPAAEAAGAMDAAAYATGNAVAFARSPDLHTAAHEAAHVVQQRGGALPSGGVGEAGDAHERHADAVADRVVRGESCEDLLDAYAGGGPASGAVQHKLTFDDDHDVLEDALEAVLLRAPRDVRDAYQALAASEQLELIVQFAALDEGDFGDTTIAGQTIWLRIAEDMAPDEELEDDQAQGADDMFARVQDETEIQATLIHELVLHVIPALPTLQQGAAWEGDEDAEHG
ncbi:MAG TPA: DUF4157 domain-containing protein, partial [Kofleriaceae bacterium]